MAYIRKPDAVMEANTAILRRRARSRVVSWLRAIDAHLGSLATAMRNGEVEATKFRHKQCCTSARRCRNLSHGLIMVRIKRLKNTEEAVATGDINSLARSVVEDIIGISDSVQVGSAFP